MKKFFIRGFCFVGIGIILLTVINSLYVRTNGYRSMDNMFKFYLFPENIEVANLGSSHGEYGINYEDIEGITGFNLALPGQSLFYDLQVLQEYYDRLSQGCVVIIPLSYFSFDQHNGFDAQNRSYCKILDYGSVANHKMMDYIRYGLFPILSASFNTKYLIKDKKTIEFDIFWFYKLMGIEYREDDVEAYRRDAQGFLDYHDSVTGHGENEEFNLTCLEGIIRLCRDNGLKPVLITMPFTRYYNELFSEDLYEHFYEMIRRVQEKCDVPYIDYSRDSRITEDLGLFVDSNHLNATGAKVFTKIMLSDLGLI